MYNVFQKNQIPLPMVEKAKPNDVKQWYFFDNEERFKKNPHPKYLKGFDYRFNNYGYRCDDFDLENDKYKILTIGCSVSFGFGLPYEETYAYLLCDRLSRKYNISIKNYNLSHIGEGMDYIARTLFQTIDIIKPDYVILLFPDINRLEYYDDKNTKPISYTLSTLIDELHNKHFDKNLKNRNKKIDDVFLTLMENENYCFFNFVKNFNFINEILKNRNIKWFWASWAKPSNIEIKDFTSEDFHSLYLKYISNLKKYIDLDNTDYSKDFVQKMLTELKIKPYHDKDLLARDWLHPGFEFNQFFANYLYDKIIEERVFENIQ